MSSRATSLGSHLLLDLEGCDPNILDSQTLIRDALSSAAREAGATIVGETFHKFSPVGVTGVVAIAESHICIHTWPEYKYAAADIFTCGTELKPRKAAQLIIDALHCETPTVTEMKRGLIPQKRPSHV